MRAKMRAIIERIYVRTRFLSSCTLYKKKGSYSKPKVLRQLQQAFSLSSPPEPSRGGYVDTHFLNSYTVLFMQCNDVR